MPSDQLPIPEVMDRRALKDDDKLKDYPPQEYDRSHCVQCSLEPDLCRQLVGVFGADARIKEDEREFDYCDSRSIEVLEDVKDLVPLFRCIRPRHCLVLAKFEVGRCPSDQPSRTKLSQESGSTNQ